MSDLDVPGKVYAALRERADLVPVGPCPADSKQAAAWWERHAAAEDAAAAAYRDLHEWALATEQPAAVTAAIGDAMDGRAREARRCRVEARVRGVGR